MFDAQAEKLDLAPLESLAEFLPEPCDWDSQADTKLWLTLIKLYIIHMYI